MHPLCQTEKAEPEEQEKCHHLSEIEFIFKYEKNVFGKITGFKWKPICMPPLQRFG